MDITERVKPNLNILEKIRKESKMQYYECKICGSHKPPKKTKEMVDMEIIYQCKKCKHKGSFEDFLPKDTMRFLFC